MINKNRTERLNSKRVHFFTLLSFFLGFLDAFFIYVLSSYFAEVVGNERVGSLYIISFALLLAALINFYRFIDRVGKVRLFFLFLIILIGSAAALSVLGASLFSLSLAVFFLIANNLLWVVLDMLLEDVSADGFSGRIRGLYLTVMNTGLLLAPFLSTLVLSRYGHTGIFAGLCIGYGFIFILALLLLVRHTTLPSRRTTFLATWRTVRTRPNLLRIFHVSLVLEFFYSIMIVYTPLLLLSRGYSWSEIGILFTVMLIPFVIAQYPIGVMADKRFGEKELLLLSLILLGGSSAFITFFSEGSLFLWGLLLFLTRVGAAAMEILRDSYFYKQIDGRESSIIAFFRTARPLSNILAALLSFFLLLFFPLEGVFLAIAFFSLTALYSVFTLQDSRP